MRTVLLIAIAAGALLSGPAPGAAYYEGPWCMKATVARGEVNICHFRTIEQCLAERSFWGNAAFCVQNPQYLPYWRSRTRTNVR